MADEAKVPIPPGVHPLFLTMSTQEKFACVEMKDCTSEKPYVYVTKKVFLDDIQFRGAISDFHPVKKQIEKYPDSEEEGLAIVWDENEDYGQNFYICLTVKATCVMMPCHHLCVCTDCEAKIVARSSGERQCVYCRERLADA